MVRPMRSVERKSTLVCLSLLSVLAAGCANGAVQWGAPAAPGSGMHAPAPASQPVATSDTSTEVAEAEPFEPEQRKRITLVEPWVQQASREYGLPASLVHGVIWVESRHQPRAKSSAGARGLMQLMPATANAMARELGHARARVYDPEFNITAGTLYLAKLLDKYNGDQTLALAAYNAGSGNVDKWMREDGELPPVSVRYVELVTDARRRFEARERGPGTRPVETLIASNEPAPADEADDHRPPAVVPEAPPPADSRPTADEPQPYDWKPEPGANDRPVAEEPPLVETPYPPNADEVFGPIDQEVRVSGERYGRPAQEAGRTAARPRPTERARLAPSRHYARCGSPTRRPLLCSDHALDCLDWLGSGGGMWDRRHARGRR